MSYRLKCLGGLETKRVELFDTLVPFQYLNYPLIMLFKIHQSVFTFPIILMTLMTIVSSTFPVFLF